jgi:predicted acetyltransferase
MKDLKLFLEHTISMKFCDLLHMFCWFVCTKTKVTTTTRERPSSYNQNNFIILMKFNRNNVGYGFFHKIYRRCPPR